MKADEKMVTVKLRVPESKALVFERLMTRDDGVIIVPINAKFAIDRENGLKIEMKSGVSPRDLETNQVWDGLPIEGVYSLVDSLDIEDEAF